MNTLFIGVDGGATKCVVRVEDEEGNLLGQETSGPANIRLSVTQAWQSIYTALEAILRPWTIAPGDPHYYWHAGMGLAGCEVDAAYQAFLKEPHDFDTLVLTSDAHTACLGAHGGNDGAIIIVGTGVVGFQVISQQTNKVAGWGFPHDDEGGGAWLGLEAVKLTLQCMDGRLLSSRLAKAIYAYFDDNLDQLVTWANQANSTAFAELAPIVIREYQQGDTLAIKLMQQAASAISNIANTLDAMQPPHSSPLPCTLSGGIASFIEPLLGEKLRSRLSPCQFTPDAGAVLLVRDYLAKHSL
ncbi:MAG: N-acetylglucosamine kinase [Gammaproteobacteria bacterium]|nr:N-acetylglucosamine kinase [Gammaproteobacteria bacterium]MCW5583303.1 N-acetylglucosamine kinase [Gammaproteobacteria bacterium]